MDISWATRPLFTFSPKVKFATKVIGAAIPILLFMSPALFTLGWHVRFGNTIQSRGKNISVPLRWVAETTSSMDVHMMKLPLSILRGARFEGTISGGRSFLPSSQGTEESYKSFETLYWHLAGANEIISGPVRTGTGAHESYCMESKYPSASTLVAARCLILQGKWDADFMGERKDLGTFFEIIQKIE